MSTSATARVIRRPAPLLLGLAMVLGLAGRAEEASPPGLAPPTGEVLAQALALDLPPAWRLAGARLEAQLVLGTAAAPEIRSRLAATIALAMPTFEAAGGEGEVALVRPVAPEGYQRQVRFQVVSVPQDGRWQSRIAAEPPGALDPPGLPAGAIRGRLIEIGSEAERDWRARREAEAAARQAEALAGQARAGALAEAHRREVEAERMQAMRATAELARLAEAHEAAAAALDAAARREALARSTALRAEVEERSRRIAELRAGFGGERNVRLAALDAAMRSDDPVIRALGFEAALASQDMAAIALALRLTLQQRRALLVVTFAPTLVAPGQADPQEVAASISGFVIEPREVDPPTGSFTGTARLGGSEAVATGSLGRAELTVALRPRDKAHPLLVGGVAQEACSLALRLSEVQTLDGIFGCTARETPRLIARIALD